MKTTMIASLLLLCALFVCNINAGPQTAQDLSIGYTGNITGQIDMNLDFEFRYTGITTWDFTDLIGCGAWFSSLAAHKGPHDIGANSIFGTAFVVNQGWPIVWLGYWSVVMDFGDDTKWFDVSLSGAAGFLASSVVQLIEKNPQGHIVNSQSLKQGWLPGTLGYDVSRGANPEGTLKWVTFHGASTEQPWTIDLTYMMSDVLGIVSYGDAVVGPKSVESVIEIKNWNYKDPQNTLSLVMGIATGNVTAQASATIISGGGKDQIYFSLATTATIGGQTVGIQISDFETGNLDTYFDDTSIGIQLAAAFVGGTQAVRAVTVTFPPGAKDIVYDPSVGVGQKPTAGAATTAVSSVLLVGMFVTLLLF